MKSIRLHLVTPFGDSIGLTPLQNAELASAVTESDTNSDALKYMVELLSRLHLALEQEGLEVALDTQNLWTVLSRAFLSGAGTECTLKLPVQVSL